MSSGEEESTLCKEITKLSLNFHKLYPETYISGEVKYRERSVWQICEIKSSKLTFCLMKGRK